MPYIKQPSRAYLAQITEHIKNTNIQTPGNLNYLFTVLAHKYLKDNGLNYQAINDIIGAAEGMKLELYRRVASSFEDKKILENGDV